MQDECSTKGSSYRINVQCVGIFCVLQSYTAYESLVLTFFQKLGTETERCRYVCCALTGEEPAAGLTAYSL
jgi:hypothetical protein